jgi:hypothetical protein
MNLAPCPDCKTMISLNAANCPKCGRVIKEGDLVPPEAKPMNPGCVIAAVIIVIVMIISGIQMSNEKKEDERIRQRILERERTLSGG